MTRIAVNCMLIWYLCRIRWFSFSARPNGMRYDL